MAYMHRVHSSEIQTGLIPVVSVPSAIPFIVGRSIWLMEPAIR